MIIVRYLDPDAEPTAFAAGNRVSEARFPSRHAASVFWDAWITRGGLCVETEDVPAEATSVVSVPGGHTVATYDHPDLAAEHIEKINRATGFEAVAVGSAPPHNPQDEALDDLRASAVGDF